MCQTINPDAMNNDKLYALIAMIEAHPRKIAQRLFPDHADGRVRAVKDIKNYCWNAITARHLRVDGNIQTAMEYESICDRIYDRMPEWARW